LCVVAVVAFDDSFGGMALQRYGAVGTAKVITAISADHKCVETAFVEKK
jgi:hypothetical protein